MAAVEDVTLSVYTEIKKFADSFNLNFAATSSIESASSILMDGTDKMVLVQNSLKDKIFLDIEYKIFVSFATITDVNALKTTEIMSSFMEQFPRFSKFCVFESSALKQVPSIYTDTGKAMVIKDIGQEVTSITQMRNNLTAIVLKLTGHIK